MAKKPPAPQPAQPGSPSTATKFQAFRLQRMARGELKAAPYNPRTIDAFARRKLQENLRKVGLVAPITVNARTGHVVSGHQRLAALDALEGTESYMLDVALVDLDERTEREQNLFLNNPSAQGQWDLDALEAMLREGDGRFLDASGFDLVDLETLFPGDAPWLAQFDPNRAAPAAVTTAAAVDATAAASAAAAAVEAAAAGKAAVKEARAAVEADTRAHGDTETYAVVMFPTREEREAFMEMLGARPIDRYVSGARVWAALGRAPGGGASGT